MAPRAPQLLTQGYSLEPSTLRSSLGSICNQNSLQRPHGPMAPDRCWLSPGGGDTGGHLRQHLGRKALAGVLGSRGWSRWLCQVAWVSIGSAFPELWGFGWALALASPSLDTLPPNLGNAEMNASWETGGADQSGCIEKVCPEPGTGARVGALLASPMSSAPPDTSP